MKNFLMKFGKNFIGTGVFKKMDVYNLLTENDLDLFTSYIKTFGVNEADDETDYALSKSYDDMASADYLLRYWRENKNHFLNKIFKDNLIIKVPISYNKRIEPKEIESLANHFFILRIKNAITKQTLPLFMENLTEPKESEVPNDLIFEYQIIDGKKVWTNWYNYCCTCLKCFLENTIYYQTNVFSGATFYIKYKNKPEFKVQKGARFSHTLYKIVKYLEIDEQGFEEWRIKHSQILNTTKVYGNLCFSIHPMDYITMSDAAFTSCMNWQNTGAYRRGTVETMNSTNAIVVYLESKSLTLDWFDSEAKECKSWNLKKWRTLLLADENLICTVKSYPFYHEELLKIVVNEFINLCQKNISCSFSEINSFKKASYHYKNTSFHFICSGDMYNDFGTTTHWISINRSFDPTNYKDIVVDYCGPTICMFCGSQAESSNFVSEAAVFCYDCMDCSDSSIQEECVMCGNIFDPESSGHYTDEGYVCDSCFDENYCYCAHCGNSILREERIPILLAFDGINVATEIDSDNLCEKDIVEGLCSSCANRINNIKLKEEEDSGTEFDRWDYTYMAALERTFKVPFSQISVYKKYFLPKVIIVDTTKLPEEVANNEWIGEDPILNLSYIDRPYYHINYRVVAEIFYEMQQSITDPNYHPFTLEEIKDKLLADTQPIRKYFTNNLW